MEHAKKQQTYAALIEKRELPYEDLAYGRGVPIIKPIYELVFLCENQQRIVCQVSEFEYTVVKEKQEGELVFVQHEHYTELVSFADIIHEFHVDK